MAWGTRKVVSSLKGENWEIDVKKVGVGGGVKRCG